MAAVNIFLVGKTGHGKSSSGNSILGRDAFSVSDSAESATFVVQAATSSIEGTPIKVVDGPGLGDTRMDNITAISKACTDTETGVRQCGDVSAFVLVLKYGNRFTEEETNTVNALKAILGPNVLRNHGVLVFTHGEIFDINNKNTALTFPTWCSQQTGGLRALMDECGNRCVLFYNASPEQMGAPLDAMLNHVNDIRSRNGSYTHAMFLGQRTAHEQLKTRANAPALRQNMDSSIQNLRQQLTNIRSSSEGFDSKLAQLATLGGQVRQLKQRVVSEDTGTGVLHSQQQSLDALGSDVSSHETTVREQKTAEANRVEAARVEAARVEAERQAAQRPPSPKPDPLSQVGREVGRFFRRGIRW